MVEPSLPRKKLKRKSYHDSPVYLPTRLPQPTSHLPGTLRKIFVLRQRVQNNEFLWHPLDRKINTD